MFLFSDYIQRYRPDFTHCKYMKTLRELCSEEKSNLAQAENRKKDMNNECLVVMENITTKPSKKRKSKINQSSKENDLHVNSSNENNSNHDNSLNMLNNCNKINATSKNCNSINTSSFTSYHNSNNEIFTQKQNIQLNSNQLIGFNYGDDVTLDGAPDVYA